jgi:hypothetical protein
LNRYLISLVFVFFAGISHAGQYSLDGLIINVPAGFEGPHEEKLGPGVTLTAFTKPHDGESNSTLLQITTWSTGEVFPEMTATELKEGSAAYLQQFLSSVARKRSNFQKSEITFVTIAGVPAAKISWTGSLNRNELHGVMYTLIHKSAVISLHTQDLTHFNSRFVDQAVSAFESIEVK